MAYQTRIINIQSSNGCFELVKDYLGEADSPIKYNLMVHVQIAHPMNCKNGIIQDIIDCAGSEPDYIYIQFTGSHPFDNSPEINITGLKLKQFIVDAYSLTHNKGYAIPHIRMDEPSDSLIYFQTRFTNISQDIVDTILESHNLRGVVMVSHPNDIKARKRDTKLRISAPKNKNIKYFVFNIGKAMVEDWVAKDLEVLMISGADLKSIPLVLHDPPASLNQVYLDNNLLTNKSVLPLRRFICGNGVKVLSISSNPTLMDIPQFHEAPDYIYYFADNVLFTPPLNPEIPDIDAPPARDIASTSLPYDAPPWGWAIKSHEELKEIPRRYSKSIYLTGNTFLSDDYSNLIGFSRGVRVNPFSYHVKANR